jgi:pantothenate kinase
MLLSRYFSLTRNGLRNLFYGRIMTGRQPLPAVASDSARGGSYRGAAAQGVISRGAAVLKTVLRQGAPAMQPGDQDRQASSASRAGSPPRVTLPIAGLAARARSLIRPGGRVLLGIAGTPGAGKSTVAEALQHALGQVVAVVGMDGFHLAQDELTRLGRQDRKGAPDTFDVFGYAALLKRLKENTDPVVYAPSFRRDLEEPIGGYAGIAPATPLIITEGNYLLVDDDGWKLARQQLDQIWFLDLPDELRQHRLTLRHQKYGKAPDAARRWATGTDQANADIVRASQNAADLIITVIDDDRDMRDKGTMQNGGNWAS